MALFSLAVGDGMAEVFAATGAITVVFGGACVLTTSGRSFELRFRDAALLTVVSWFVVPAFGGLPLLAEPAEVVRRADDSIHRTQQTDRVFTMAAGCWK